jgi:hypothetical protein
MSREDPDVSEARQIMRVHGRSGKEVTLVVRTISPAQKVEGSDNLVAAGASWDSVEQPTDA